MNSLAVDLAPSPEPEPSAECRTPMLYVDLASVLQRYDELAAALPGVRLHYAVKANPAPQVIAALAAHGCAWDVASPGEIDAVLAAGGTARAMSYGNTVKHAADIAYDEHAGWLRHRRGPYTLLANFSQRDVHVPVEATLETVLATHHATLEPGFVVLPALSGVLLK